MLKNAATTILLGGALSCLSLSCAANSPMKMAGAGSSGGSVATGSAAPATPVATAGAAAPDSSGTFLVFSGLAFFTLVGGSIYACRYKPT